MKNHRPTRRGTGGGYRREWLSTGVLLAGLLAAGPHPGASAREFRVGQLPNGAVFGCANCHVSAGGGGARNAFGQAVGLITGPSNRAFWSATLAAADSDRDGTANGAELGDPDGDGTPIAGARVTNPGNAASKPPENQAPSVTVVAPVDGGRLSLPAVQEILAEASDADGSIASVEFFSNGQSLGVVREAPYRLLVDWALGPHTVTARAIDNAGGATTSAPVAISVDPPQPPILDAPARVGTGLRLVWASGGGPFVVESQTAIGTPWFAVSRPSMERVAAVAARNGSGLFRVTDLATQESVRLTAVLGGAFERPNPVPGAGAGTGTFTLAGNTLTFEVQYSGLSGPAINAHIHGEATMDANAGVMIDLAPFNGGAFGTSGALSGAVVLTPAQKASVLAGLTYVNIHTDANRGGEIRGQILPVLMQAVLNGGNERPTPVSTAGWGSGWFLLEGTQLRFSIAYQGLSGPATLAHIHGPADVETTAGPIIDLAPFNGGAFGSSGGLSGTVTLSPDQLVAVASGLTYVNIHTDANRSGEIRGQVVPSVAATPLVAVMDGANERPTPVQTSGTGLGILALAGDRLSFSIAYQGLGGPATLAHIHGPADASASAPPLVDLAPFVAGAWGVRGAMSGTVSIAPDVRTSLLEGQTYVNIHTDANRAGEIRGQVVRPGGP